MNTGDASGMQETAELAVMATARPVTITTTLYDLIEAMASVVPDELVVPTVVHLLRSGRIRSRGREDARIVAL